MIASKRIFGPIMAFLVAITSNVASAAEICGNGIDDDGVLRAKNMTV